MGSLRKHIERTAAVLAVAVLILCIGSIIARVGENSHNDRTPIRDKPLEAGMSNQVVDGDQPLAGVRVQRAGSDALTTTDAAGRFDFIRKARTEVLSFWKEGYFFTSIDRDIAPIKIQLRRLPSEDDESYHWRNPDPDFHWKGYEACGRCHPAIFDEWKRGTHANATSDRHFVNLTDGSHFSGRPNVGWNLKSDHPDGVNVCASCHNPTQPSVLPSDPESRQQQPSMLSGVHCDYCHKIVGPAPGEIGLAHGRFGLALLRSKDQQVLFGPLQDSTRGDNAFSAFQHESRLCASCHEATVFGVAAYTTYSEWQASPAGRAGVQCQDCHMKPTGKMTNIAPGHGGVERDPMKLANHVFFDGSRESMLRGSLKLSASAQRLGSETHVTVEVKAEGVGHRVPTGFVDHNLVLLVEALNIAGSTLPVQDGPRLPAVAGSSVHGQAGRLFAKQLKDFSGRSPAPFWRADPELTDTRLEPGKAEQTTWRFPAMTTKVRVRLLYRRFWPEVAAAKGWTDNETPIAERTVSVSDSAD